MHFKEENITGNKLTHMIHNEDLIWYGQNAINLMYSALYDVFEMLEGSTEHKMKTTMKIDGAPSVICASDYNGRSFVATKGFFAKTPKIAFTEEDCDRYYESPDLAHKMKQLLKWASALNIPKNEMWQGDFLFSHADLKKESINNEECITFKPNTIIYSIPINDPIAKTILRADIGVCWHTRYRNVNNERKVSFDVNVHELNTVPSVFQMDVNIPNIAGRVTLTEDETLDISSKLILLKNNLKDLLKEPLYIELINDANLIENLMSYENFIIKTKGIQSLGKDDIYGIIKKLFDEEDKAISKLKKQNAIENHEAKKAAFKKKIEYFQEIILKVWKIQQQIVYIKEFFIKKLNNLSSMKTYVQYIDRGYIPCSGEGFAISDIDGNVQKMVSRLEFSKNNFSQEVVKGWTSEKRMNEDIENIINPVLYDSNLEIEDKKPPRSTFKGAKQYFTIQPTKNTDEPRSIKAQKVFDILKDNPDLDQISLQDLGDHGTTPTIIASKTSEDGYTEEAYIEFKPRDDKGRSNASATEADEVYWAYCMALYQNGFEDLLPKTEDDLKELDLTFLNLKKDQHPKVNNLKGYVEGSKKFCDEYLVKGKNYLFFREEKSIDTSLLNFSSIISSLNSIHTLINEAAFKVMGHGFQKDVWNPADIVACEKNFYKEFKEKWDSLLESAEPGNFTPFNFYLLECINNKSLVCISLKDIRKMQNINLLPQNFDIKEEINEDTLFEIKEIRFPAMFLQKQHKKLFPGRSASEVSMKVTTEGKEIKFQYRIFSGKSMQIEGTETSAAAHLGKSGKAIIHELYKEFNIAEKRERSSLESANIMNNNPEIMLEELEAIKKSTLPLNQAGSFNNELNVSAEDWFNLCKAQPDNLKEAIFKITWPRMIDFLYLFVSQENNPNNINYILNKIMKGCMKTIKGCAPFIKIC